MIVPVLDSGPGARYIGGMLRLPLVHRLRFSLRTFLVTLFVFSLIGSNLYVSFKWRRAQSENQRLRDEGERLRSEATAASEMWQHAIRKIERLRDENEQLREEFGAMTVGDQKRFYFRELQAFEPLSWKWHVYVPPGQHSLRLATEQIPETGITAGPASGGTAREGEYTLTARAECDQLGNWRLTVSAPDWIETQTILPKDASWLSAGRRVPIAVRRNIYTSVVGCRGDESFGSDETVVLLRVRAPQPQQAANHEPCDGVMVWFE